MTSNDERARKYRDAMFSDYCGCGACERQLEAVMAVADAEQAELALNVDVNRAKWKAAEAKVARLAEQLQHECPHGEMSWSGVDQNWGHDKIWRCDNCGKEGVTAALDGDS